MYDKFEPLYYMALIVVVLGMLTVGLLVLVIRHRRTNAKHRPANHTRTRRRKR